MWGIEKFCFVLFFKDNKPSDIMQIERPRMAGKLVLQGRDKILGERG